MDSYEKTKQVLAKINQTVNSLTLLDSNLGSKINKKLNSCIDIEDLKYYKSTGLLPEAIFQENKETIIADLENMKNILSDLIDEISNNYIQN